MRVIAAGGRFSFRLTVIAATLVLLAVAALPVIEYRALIVTSGSMEPVLSAGDAAIIHLVPVDELRAGDVITYQGYGSEQLTTHRIVKAVELESGLHFQTQGDANSSPDPNLAPAGGVVGRFVTGVPGLGQVLLRLARPNSRLVMVGLPTVVILVSELRFLAAHRAALTFGGRGARIVAGLFVATVVAVGAWTSTGAVMTDATTVGDNTIATADTFPAG